MTLELVVEFARPVITKMLMIIFEIASATTTASMKCHNSLKYIAMLEDKICNVSSIIKIAYDTKTINQGKRDDLHYTDVKYIFANGKVNTLISLRVQVLNVVKIITV